MTKRTRLLAVLSAAILAVPALFSTIEAGEKAQKKNEEKIYSTAKEVLESFKELSKELGKEPTEEQLAAGFGKAFSRAATYIAGHPKSVDHGELYRWAGARLQYGPPHEGFIRLSTLYLKANANACDARDWQKWQLVAKLGNESHAKEGQEALKKLEAEAKNDAAKAVFLADVKFTHATRKKDDAAAREIIKALMADKRLTETKDAALYRDFARLVLGANPASIKVGEAFPDWADVISVRDTGGESISPADYKGKIVVIEFWSAWCQPCLKDMPNMVKLYKELNEQGMVVIGVSLDNDEAQMSEAITKHEMSWRQIYDGGGWNSGLARRYGVNSIPRTVVLDAEGKVASDGLRGERLYSKIRELVTDLKTTESK